MFNSIVVGTDGSPTAERAVREAFQLARRSGGRLHIVSSCVPITAMQYAAASPIAMPYAPDALEQTSEMLSETAGRYAGNGVEVETHVCRGEPADAIIDVAEQQKADLIVVGDKGMHGKRRYLLGSVPDRVSHHAPCSVMIVRTTSPRS